MGLLDLGGRWLRDRRARRLLERARHAPDVDEGLVEDLEALLPADPRSRRAAAEALESLARRRDPSSARARATDRLVDLLGDDDPALQAAAARALRYVALERPDVVERLDDPYAAILGDGRHDAHREVAVDAGMVLSEVTAAAEDLPATREALRETLAGGSDRDRRSAALAYVLAADRAGAFDHPGEIAEGLAILGSGIEGDLPAESTTVQSLAEGRTLTDAVTAFREASRGSGDGGEDGERSPGSEDGD